MADNSLRDLSVCVIVPTYKRNHWLGELQQCLLAELAGSPRSFVLVVDNSPNGDAASLSNGVKQVKYLHEPTPGIVAARNRALDHLDARNIPVDYIVFIDDDELPTRGWLDILVSGALALDADAAIGPVIPVLPDGTSTWLVRGGFFQRIRMRTGDTPPWGTTNNTVISWKAIKGLAYPRFSSEFSLTGGSDAELFWRMRNENKSLVWVDEAVIYERFNSDRATWKWISKRNIRLGNVSARLKLRSKSKFHVFILGTARVAVGSSICIARLLTFRVPSAKGHSHLFKGLGMISEVFGTRVVEYKRST